MWFTFHASYLKTTKYEHVCTKSLIVLDTVANVRASFLSNQSCIGPQDVYRNIRRPDEIGSSSILLFTASAKAQGLRPTIHITLLKLSRQNTKPFQQHQRGLFQVIRLYLSPFYRVSNLITFREYIFKPISRHARSRYSGLSQFYSS